MRAIRIIPDPVGTLLYGRVLARLGDMIYRRGKIPIKNLRPTGRDTASRKMRSGSWHLRRNRQASLETREQHDKSPSTISVLLPWVQPIRLHPLPGNAPPPVITHNDCPSVCIYTGERQTSTHHTAITCPSRPWTPPLGETLSFVPI